MSRRTIARRQLAAVAAFSLLAACARNPPQPVASNPPPVAPGANAVWYTVYFDKNSFAIDGDGQKVINDVIAFLQHHPDSVATIIGGTDTSAAMTTTCICRIDAPTPCATRLFITAR